LGTHDDNMADMSRKGRADKAPRGERHHSARLTASDVREIRTDGRPLAVLSAAYGVTPSTISRARAGLSWKRSA
jgi:hypothetical protein